MVWDEGYVSEINYTYGFYGHLSPNWSNFATLIKATQPLREQGDFTYCELACGHGYTTNLLAAAYPQGKFYATDFNPSQIAGAKALAEAAGSSNVHFFDDSFQEFCQRDLPQFDYISLHGIYSWITEQNRQAILDFLGKKLKVGGIVNISYNALPGWASAMPLRELLFRNGERSANGIIDRIEEALNFAGQLIESDAGYFNQNPTVKLRYEQLKEMNRHYLAHEYFCQDWHPLYFDQVVAELNVAKLQYVGSGNILDHVDAVNLSPAAQQQLSQIKDPIYREVLRDYFLNTQFRRDLFGRGVQSLTGQEQSAQLQQMRFALTVPLGNVKLNHRFPVGEVSLQETVYQPICEVLASAPLTLGQLQQHEKTHQIHLNSLFQALVILTGIGYVHPAVADEICQQRKQSTDAFNASIKAKAFYSNDFNYLASPLIGTGVVVNRLEQIFLEAKSQNQDLATFAWQTFSSLGQGVVKEGKLLETPEESLSHLKQLAEEFCEQRLQMLNQLGID